MSPNDLLSASHRASLRRGLCLSSPTALFLMASLVLSGCVAPRETPQERDAAARALFESTTRHFLIPSAEAQGTERIRLQDEAAAGFRDLLKQYSDQEFWAAQALRSLGNIAAARTNLTAAVRYYDRVSQDYPGQEWEILMAWKSAADLLWDHGRQEDALPFYQKIVSRFDQPGQTQVVQTVVRGSQRRLRNNPSLPP